MPEASSLDVLLLPGLDGTAQLFDLFIATRPPDYAPKPLPLPNDTSSYRELTEFVLKNTPRPERWILVAESFSTPLAVLTAAARPSGLCGLVLVAGFVRSPVPTWFRWLPHRLFFQLPTPRWAIRASLAHGCSPAIADACARAMRSTGAGVLAARATEVLSVDCGDELAELRLPVLYIRAANDRIVRHGSALHVRSVRPDCDLVTVSGPHLLLQSAPESAWEVIDSWVKRWSA